jgi:hypothetical protein
VNDKAIKALPLEVAAACGYVPGVKLPWWKVWWNRLLLRISPVPPRVKVWQSKDDVPPMQPGIWKREDVTAIIGSAEAQAKLFAMQAQIDRVLAQDAVTANKYWQEYDAKATEVLLSGTHVIAVTGTYVPHKPNNEQSDSMPGVRVRVVGQDGEVQAG